MFILTRKGVFTLMIAVCLLLAFPVAAKAQPFVEQEKLPGGIVVPMWDYMNDINTTLSISTTGTTTVSGSITGYPSITTRVSIYLYLQQYKDGAWTIIDSWYGTFDSYRGILEGTLSVSPGYSYRVMTSYYAYSGSNYENIIDYSQIVSY